VGAGDHAVGHLTLATAQPESTFSVTAMKYRSSRSLISSICTGYGTTANAFFCSGQRAGVLESWTSRTGWMGRRPWSWAAVAGSGGGCTAAGRGGSRRRLTYNTRTGFSTVQAADRIYVLNEGPSGGNRARIRNCWLAGDVRGAVHAAGVAVPVVCDERYQAAASGLRIYVPRSGHEVALDNRPA
jgi:hypothetical protein